MRKSIHVRKLLGVLVATSMLLSSFVVCAEDNTYGSDVAGCQVVPRFELEDTYTIVMPATFNLIYNENTGAYEGSYTILCKSRLVNGESVVVRPHTYTPTFRWGNGGNTSQNYLIESVLVQPIDTWTTNPQESNEVRSSSTDFVPATGTITIPSANLNGKTAGSWYTNLNFTFTKTSTNP